MTSLISRLSARQVDISCQDDAAQVCIRVTPSLGAELQIEQQGLNSDSVSMFTAHAWSGEILLLEN